MSSEGVARPPSSALTSVWGEELDDGWLSAEGVIPTGLTAIIVEVRVQHGHLVRPVRGSYPAAEGATITQPDSEPWSVASGLALQTSDQSLWDAWTVPEHEEVLFLIGAASQRRADHIIIGVGVLPGWRMHPELRDLPT